MLMTKSLDRGYPYRYSGIAVLVVGAVLTYVGYTIAVYEVCNSFTGVCVYPYDAPGTNIALVGAVLLAAGLALMFVRGKPAPATVSSSEPAPQPTPSPRRSVVCPGCNRSFFAGAARFCPYCGRPLPQ